MTKKQKFILLMIFFLIIESILLVKGRAIINFCSTLEIVFDSEIVQKEDPIMRYHSAGLEFDDSKAIVGDIKGNIMSFSLKTIGSKSTIWFEVSPEAVNNVFAISEIRLKLFGIIIEKYTAEILQNNFFELYNIEYIQRNDNTIFFYTTNDEPSIVFNLGFHSKIFLIIASLFFVIWLFFSLSFLKNWEIENIYIRRLILIIGAIVTLLGGMLWVLKSYLVERFGSLPLFQLIIYHLNEPLKGTNLGEFKELFYRLAVAGFTLTVAIIAGYIIFRYLHKKFFYMVNLLIGGSLLFVFSFSQICTSFDLIDYIQYSNEKTEIYDNYYVDPKSIQLKFPNEKRNLIYIFVESMEITFADEKCGGAKKENYIPELTALIKNGCDFSDGKELNGAYVFNGNDFTTGAMVGQTAGIPLNGRILNNKKLNGNTDELVIKGIYTLGDILSDNGYNQLLMIGSEAEFGGRRTYFEQHGKYSIFDYNSAIKEGYIPEDYKVWWGFEDEKLFRFAKDKVLELSNNDAPFNLTLLTVDTHFTDGYICELCNDKYIQQYSNVLACASRQIADFVSWIKKQDFYKNTTIVICGDHLYMDSIYGNDLTDTNYQRKTYVNYINSASDRKDLMRREYSTLDLFPTTLASLGVVIEGDRMGLGTNLFSDQPTLVEILGYGNVNAELMKNSLYYTDKIILGQ